MNRCEVCGSTDIKEMNGDVVREFRGKEIKIPNVSYYKCQACSEVFYDAEALAYMERHLPKRPGPRRTTKTNRISSLYLTEELYNWLDARAERNHRGLSGEVKAILEEAKSQEP